MSVKLLPCPFCGSNAHVTEEDNRFYAAYDHCFCSVGEAYDGYAMPSHCFYEEDAAAAAWNARSVTVELPEWPKPL